MLTLVKLSGRHVPHGVGSREVWSWPLRDVCPLWAHECGRHCFILCQHFLLKPHFVELRINVRCECRKTACRPRGERERLCFAPSSPSQIVSFRDGCQVIGHDENSFAPVATSQGLLCCPQEGPRPTSPDGHSGLSTSHLSHHQTVECILCGSLSQVLSCVSPWSRVRNINRSAVGGGERITLFAWVSRLRG